MQRRALSLAALASFVALTLAQVALSPEAQRSRSGMPGTAASA